MREQNREEDRIAITTKMSKWPLGLQVGQAADSHYCSSCLRVVGPQGRRLRTERNLWCCYMKNVDSHQIDIQHAARNLNCVNKTSTIDHTLGNWR